LEELTKRLEQVFLRANGGHVPSQAVEHGRWLVERLGPEELDALWPILETVRWPIRATEVLEQCWNFMAGLQNQRLEALRRVLLVAGSSSGAARVLGIDPAFAEELGTCSLTPKTGVAHAQVLSTVVRETCDDTEAFDQRLRQYRNREMARLAMLELLAVDVRKTSRELADLASTCVQAALDHHLPKLEKALGTLEPPCRHVVMGMGKLGGRELNYCSDIDLIYLYETDAAETPQASAHVFFARLFERVTASLNRATSDRFVFRVDLDLRPEGRSGPIVNSLPGLERYYESWGRIWERAVWVKARPVAGDLSLGEEARELLRPFVFPKSLDFKAIEEIVEMKRRIAGTARYLGGGTSGIRGIDVKKSPGGIRDIEFFAQVLQLVYGGRNERIRKRNTLVALKRLEVAGHLSARVRSRLTSAYIFFRRVEHQLQLVDDRPTHVVPEDDWSFFCIASRIGFDDPEMFGVRLASYMADVERLFQALLGESQDRRFDEDGTRLLVDLGVERRDRLKILEDFGVEHPERGLDRIEQAIRMSGGPFHPRAGAERFEIGVRFLRECLLSPDADRALTHLPEVIRALAVHGLYIEALDGSEIRRGLARALGASDLLARILTANPRLLPEVLIADASMTSGGQVEDEDAPALEDLVEVEDVLDRLRQIKQTELLRIAMADLADRLTTREVGHRLSRLADRLVGATFRLAHREAMTRYGATPPTAQVALVAGGSLGAQEMGYRSDVDLLVFYNGEGMTQGGTRNPIAVGEFFTRLTQRLLSFLTVRTSMGLLYSVDLRLRPSGRQGTLVTHIDRFEAHHAQGSAVWERQALTRMRVLEGDGDFSKRVSQAVEAAAYESTIPFDVVEQVDDMRRRLLPKSINPSIQNLKFGIGGLIEIEFLVQALLLKHGGARPSVRKGETDEALRALAAEELLDVNASEGLRSANLRLRRLLNWQRLSRDEALDHIDVGSVRLRNLARVVGYDGEDAADQLTAQLKADQRTIHDAYLDRFPGSSR
jgi:[glutamine synthetase] adenylyltransferase / [glutamine synthetase]-adenylyl-L-tyrosine phosphorylase